MVNIMENSIKMNNLEFFPLFLETPIRIPIEKKNWNLPEGRRQKSAHNSARSNVETATHRHGRYNKDTCRREEKNNPRQNLGPLLKV